MLGYSTIHTSWIKDQIPSIWSLTNDKSPRRYRVILLTNRSWQCIVIVQNPRTWLLESDITRDIVMMFTHWLFWTRIPAPGSSPILTLSTPRSTRSHLYDHPFGTSQKSEFTMQYNLLIFDLYVLQYCTYCIRVEWWSPNKMYMYIRPLRRVAKV